MHSVVRAAGGSSIPIHIATPETWDAMKKKLDPAAAAYAAAAGFEPKAGKHTLLPGEGGVAAVLVGADAEGRPARDRFALGRLSSLLPPGTYRLAEPPGDAKAAWGSPLRWRWRTRKSPIC
jgi:leucyl aminopeptidase